MKNYISQNIKYLREENNYGQDVFGSLFDLSKDVISSYEKGRALPKIETIQKICAHFKITIDDFVNRELREVQRVAQPGYIDPYMEAQALNDPTGFYGPGIVIEELRKQIADKEKLITVYETRINELEGTKTKRQAG